MARKLIDELGQLFINANHPSTELVVNTLKARIPEVEGENEQRFFINRALRLIIGMYPGDTTNVRYCLIEDGTTDDWVRMMESTVVPFIVKHDLDAMKGIQPVS